MSVFQKFKMPAFKIPDYVTMRDFARNIHGRYQLFLVLFHWDRLYRREIIVTILAFGLINYSILDMDNPFDWVALLVEGVILWIQLGSDYSILPREYRPSQNGVKFSVGHVRSATVRGEKYGFEKVLLPDSAKKLKMYNPFPNKDVHAEVTMCSNVLDDYFWTAKEMPCYISEAKRNYIASVHQIRYLAIRVANNKQHTTNGQKVSLCNGVESIMSGEPIPMCKETFFEGLLTSEAFRSCIYRQNLRGDIEINTDLTQYFPAEPVEVKGEKYLKLVDRYFDVSSGYLGATSLLFNENNRLVMLFQGAGKAMEASKIHLGGSGSMDFSDFVGVDDLRDGIRDCMARETIEETGVAGHFYDEVYKNTRAIGLFHWMDRAAKPEFGGITKAGSISFMKEAALDGDEIVGMEELPITINKLSDFNKVLDYAIKNKLPLSISSLMPLHRMTVIAGYNKKGATKAQKQIYKEMEEFLFAK